MIKIIDIDIRNKWCSLNVYLDERNWCGCEMNSEKVSNGDIVMMFGYITWIL